MNTEEQDELIIEKAIYLPLLVIILNRDLKVIAESQLKIKEPYIQKVEDTLRAVQVELSKIKKYMYANNIKILKLGTKDAFTEYLVVCRGYEEKRKIFSHVLRTRSEELLSEYLLK